VKDRRTPLGSYRVRRINGESRFHIFFGFDYPNLQQSQSAFRAGRINYDQLKSIRKAHYLRREPPSDTPLGGLIGIHGLGNGDPGIHEEYNWTDGCIALTNEDVDELAGWIRLGTRVEVH
jgi:murein L,D-transpeptidase YafK